MAELTSQALRDPDRPGTPSELSCPDCHGILYGIDDPAVPRYRCRVGHAWSLQSLTVFQDQEVMAAIWTALRTVEERVSVYRGLVGRSREAGRSLAAAGYDERGKELHHAAEVIRDLLLSGSLDAGDEDGDQDAPRFGASR